MKIEKIKIEIANGRSNSVINELISIISLYEKEVAKKDDLAKIKNEVYLLSARVSSLQEHERKNTLDFNIASIEKTKITNSLLDLIDEIRNYNHFFDFLNSELSSIIIASENNKERKQIATKFVKNFMEKKFNVLFEEFRYSNKDELDGLIYIRRRNGNLGDKIHYKLIYDMSLGYDVRLKNHIRINVDKGQLESCKQKWQHMENPVIVFYVIKDNKGFTCWWGDLKSEKIFAPDNKNQLLIHKQQKLGIHSFGNIKKLFGYKLVDEDLQTIILDRNDVNYFPISKSIKSIAREYYKEWSNSPEEERRNPALGEVIINRVGWRHMTRKSRTCEKIIQSWFLFGAARKMIKEVETFMPLGHNKYVNLSENRVLYKDYVGLKCKVVFPQRFASPIMIVLKRQQVYDSKYGNNLQNKKVWLYSIYESRRG